LDQKENKMNFTDLLTKMKTIDEGGEIINPVDAVEECGGIMSTPHMSAPKQQDNLTMNVSMNGSGAGGVRDLLNVLKDIQDGPEHDTPDADSGKHDVLIGEPEESYEEDVNDGGFGMSTNNPDTTTLDISDVVNVGAPINGGDHRPRQAGLPMGNPQVQEGLVNHLSNLYNEVKSR
jgi:hypothetical protein